MKKLTIEEQKENLIEALKDSSPEFRDHMMNIINSREPKLWTIRGEWDNEPAQSHTHTYKGYTCYFRRNPIAGNWCGYIHLPDNLVSDDLDLHGGVTYTKTILPDNAIPAKEGYQWVGFDCAHYDDLIPLHLSLYVNPFTDEKPTYKTLKYCIENVEHVINTLDKDEQ